MKLQKKTSTVDFYYIKKRITSIAINLYLILYIVFTNISTIYATEHILDPVDDTNEIDSLNILSESVLLYDVDNKIVIFEKNGYEEKYPASITKVMTALLTLEHADSNLQDTVYFSHDAVFSIPYNSSHIAMDEGETLTVENALYGLLLESANEVSNALAEYVSGSVESFGALMTSKAKELGANDTNFVNAHGLHDDNHYTTPYDMALIMSEAIKHEKFNEIGGTYSYNIPPTEKQPEERPLHNSNRMINSGSQYYNSDVIVGKTGFTNEAQHTLITYATRDDINLIAVVMYGNRYEPYVDTETLLEYGFSSYEDIVIQNANDNYNTINLFAEKEAYYTNESNSIEEDNISAVENEKPIGEIDLYIEEVSVKLPANIAVGLEKNITYYNRISSNIESGHVLGFIDYTYEDTIIESAPMYAKTSFNYDEYLLSLEKKSIIETIKNTIQKIVIIFIVLLLLIIIFIFAFRQYNLRNKTKRNKYR